MTPVNDAPAISVNMEMPIYAENAPPVPIAAEATVVDPDSPNFAAGSVSVTISSGSGGDDFLTVINRNGVTFEEATGRVFYDDGCGAAEGG